MEKSERRFQALSFLLDYSRGTLWRVKDRIWDKVIEGFVMKRKEHPGLSLGRKKLASLYDTIPMLIGTSKKHGRSLVVRDFYEDSDSTGKVTYFCVLRPYPIRFDEFGSSERILHNITKPRLDDNEMKQLDYMLKFEEA